MKAVDSRSFLSKMEELSHNAAHAELVILNEIANSTCI